MFLRLVFIKTVILCILYVNIAQANTIVAFVNGMPITKNEVSQRQKLMQISGEQSKNALNELIDDKIKLSNAKKIGITISEAEAENAFASIAKSTNSSPEKLTQILASRGIDVLTLKEKLKADIAWRQLVQIRNARDNPSQLPENETLSKFLKIDGNNTEGYSEYNLARIVVTSQNGNKQAARAQAEALRSKISSCANLLEKYSSLSDVVVNAPTVKSSKELSPTLVSFLEKSAIGKATPAFESDSGFEIGVLCGRNAFNGGPSQTKKIKPNLASEQKKLQELSVSYLKNLKSEATIDIQQ